MSKLATSKIQDNTTARIINQLAKKVEVLENLLQAVTRNNSIVLDHKNLLNKGVNTHTQIDSHLTNAPTGLADPTASVGLTAVNGTATTAMRSDAAPPIDQGIIPTWTGQHTFSAESVHNGGIDLGTGVSLGAYFAGRIDSNVPNSGTNIGVVVRPTTAFSDDTKIFDVQDSTGKSAFHVRSDGRIGLLDSGSTQAAISISPTISAANIPMGIFFAPTFTNAGGALDGYTGMNLGAYFAPIIGSGSTATRNTGGLFVGQVINGTPAAVTDIDAVIALRKVSQGGGATHTNLSAITVPPIRIIPSARGKQTITNSWGLRIYDTAYTGTLTNQYGVWLEELTDGATINREIFIEGAGEVFFRDNDIRVGSQADGHLDLEADTSIDMNADVDIADANDVILGTTTGTKFGTATSQKLAFFNSTPIVQPTAGGVTGVAGGGGTNVDDQTTFTGGVGATAYTIGDLVASLKNLGLIAA